MTTLSSDYEICRLPVVVSGRTIDSADEYFEIQSNQDVIEIPKLTSKEINQALSAENALVKLSVDEITSYLEEVGKAWRSNSNPWRKIAREWGARFTGYHSSMIDRDLDFLGIVLERSELYDFLETDLQDPALLDEWRAFKAVYRRLWPVGTVAHILVGNVPLTAPISIVRSLITKNLTIAKVPKRNPAVALAFANCVTSIDPHHPVAQALTCCHWDPEGALEAMVIEKAQAVTVWGKQSTVTSFSDRIDEKTRLVVHGPKKSISVVLGADKDLKQTAFWIAYDVVSYDQEACFSTQEVFVVKDQSEELHTHLAYWLQEFDDNIDRRTLTEDEAAHVFRTRVESQALGCDIHCSDTSKAGWTIVKVPLNFNIDSHPLARTIFVREIETLDDVTPFISEDIQTVTVSPTDSMLEVAESLCRIGADRIVPVGRSARFRNGFIHDGFLPMLSYVRWATIERPRKYLYRFDKASQADDFDRFASWASGERLKP